MTDRGHNRNCVHYQEPAYGQGSCHCDHDMSRDAIRDGLSYAGWHNKEAHDDPLVYFWREISDCEAIQLNRLEDGWEFRWIKGESTWIYGSGYATPKHAIAALYEDMNIMLKLSAEYQAKIHNFRSALQGLKL